MRHILQMFSGAIKIVKEWLTAVNNKSKLHEITKHMSLLKVSMMIKITR